MPIFKWFLLIIMATNWSLKAGERIVVALGSVPNNLHPYYATDANSQDINRLVHLSLIDVNARMQTICRACESFEEVITAGGEQEIIFKLKKQLKYQDGEMIKAIQVRDAVMAVIKEDKAPIPAMFRNLKNAEVIDEMTVKIIFESYRPENLNNLALLKIFKNDRQKIVAAGDYTIAENSESSILLTGPKKIEFKFIADETTMVLKLLNNEIDLIATSVSARKIEWLKKQKNIKTFEKEGTNYVYIAPSFKNEHLKKLAVRRALSHLINRTELIEYKMKNSVDMALGMYSKSFTDLAIDKSPKKYAPDIAHRLLKSAGYELINGRWTYQGKELSFTLKVSNKKHIIELAKAMIPYWQKNGISVRMQSAEWGAFYRDLKSGNFDLALGQWVGFVGPDQMGFTFLSENYPPNGANRGYYQNTNFEQKYKSALESKDRKERQKYFRQAYEILIDDEAYLSLWHPRIIWIGRDCVRNIEIYPTGNFLAFETLEHACLR